MSLRRSALVVMVVVVMIGAGFPSHAANRQVGQQPQGGSGKGTAGPLSSVNDVDAVEGEIVVRFDVGVAPSAKHAALGAIDAVRDRNLGLPGLQLIRLRTGDVETAIEALERRPDVLYAEPNFLYEATETPNDPRFADLWGLHNTGQTVNGVAGTADADIDAPEAWDVTTGDSSVVVAVVDTGVAWDHPDLAANMWSNGAEIPGNGIDDDGNGFVDDIRGWDFVDDDNDPFDFQLHGTHVAGTIGAKGDNGTGITGVAWDVSLMPLRALGTTGSGSNAGITEAFNYAGDNGAHVVNASLGGGGFSAAMSSAITGASETLFVVAAGNSASNNDLAPTYPCDYTAANLVCVAATNSHDALASFSNFGSASVDLAAPGTSTLSTLPNFETQLSENFEDAGWTSRWTTGGTPNTWARMAGGPFGFFLADSPSGNYASNSNTFARTTSPVDFSGLQGCQVGYRMDLETESGFDALLVEGSTDATNWAIVGAWTGSTLGQFDRFTEDLTSFDDEPEAFLRYRLVSDSSVNFDGANIDNVDIKCIPAGYEGDEYGFLNGTSMATPHVAGAAALLWAADPSATVAEVRDALLDGVDARPSLAGKMVTGGRLNARSSLDLLVDTTPPDTTPPDTTITSGPAQGSTTDSTSATFGFASTESGSTFECKLDTGDFETCTSPKGYTGLDDGSHTFSVQATDAAGNTDPTPATRTWTIDTSPPPDTTPPDTKITKGPTGKISKKKAKKVSFGFKSTEAGSTFECKMDKRSWKSCTSPKVYRKVKVGGHTFRVRATDQAGNTDPTPAKRSFKVVRPRR